MVVLPLDYKYKIDIFNSVADSLLQSDTKLTYSALYDKTLDKLDCTLSHRDFANCLQAMVNENVLHKVDETGKRGSKVYYSLSENAKQQHQLKILDIDDNYWKRRSLYQILLYFHSFKRGILLSERQLKYNLKKIGLRFKELQELNTDKNLMQSIDQLNQDLKTKYTQIRTLTDSSGSLGIVKYIENADSNAKRENIKYYFYSQGFTVEEFKTYIKKLKKMREPRPFSKDAPLVPYVYYTDYNDSEIEEAIQLFYKARLIENIPPITIGEIRYHISDSSLVDLITIIRKIQEAMYYKIIAKLAYIERPDETDRQILELYFGKKVTDLTIAKAHEIRKNLRKRPLTQTESKKIMQQYDDKIAMWKDILFRLHGRKFNPSELLADLLVGFPLQPLRTRLDKGK